MFCPFFLSPDGLSDCERENRLKAAAAVVFSYTQWGMKEGILSNWFADHVQRQQTRMNGWKRL